MSPRLLSLYAAALAGGAGLAAAQLPAAAPPPSAPAPFPAPPPLPKGGGPWMPAAPDAAAGRAEWERWRLETEGARRRLESARAAGTLDVPDYRQGMEAYRDGMQRYRGGVGGR